MASELGRGAQVRLDGDVRQYARGGTSLRLIDNIREKLEMEEAGTAPTGNNADGSLADGTAADDEVLVPGGAEAVFNFTQAGTGAEARTVQGKLRDECSAFDFIPVSEHAAITARTSTLDVSSYCNAAMTAAVAAKVRLKLRGGTYLMGTRLSVPTGGHIAGDLGAVLKATAGNVGTVLLLSGFNQTDIRVEGVTFDGNVAGITSGQPVTQMLNCQRVKLKKCRWTNTRGIAVNLSTSIVNLAMEDCDFDNAGAPNGIRGSGGKQAIALTEAVYGNSRHLRFKNLSFDVVGLDCISLSGSKDVVFEGITGTDFGAALLYSVTGTTNSHWTMGNLTARTNDGGLGPNFANALDLPGLTDSTIDGVVLPNAAGCGIGLFGVHRITVNGAICTNGHQHAASLHNAGVVITAGSTAVTLNGLICTDTQGTKTQGYGVLMDASVRGEVHIGPDCVLSGNAIADIGYCDADYVVGTTTAAPIERFGLGSPESVVTAPPGSRYYRTDGSTSTTLYVKTSGTGNTGWTAK